MGKIIAAYGGGFKPPTKGHFKVVTDALAKFPEIDEFIIYVGSGTRDGISQLESILVWEVYNNYLPMKVKIEPSKSPIGDIIRLGKNNPQDTIYFVIGSREGNEEDQKDYESRTKNIEEKYPNMEVKLITTPNTGISGTKARKALLTPPEEFYKFTPEELNDNERGEVFDTLRQSISETLNEISLPKATQQISKLNPDVDAEEVAKDFIRLSPNLDKKDLFQYSTYDELEQELNKVSQSKSQRRKQAKSMDLEDNKFIFYKDDNFTIYKLDDPSQHPESCEIAQGAKICVASNSKKYWNQYMIDGDGVLFYIRNKKHDIPHPQSVIAFMFPRKGLKIGYTEMVDYNDDDFIEHGNYEEQKEYLSSIGIPTSVIEKMFKFVPEVKPLSHYIEQYKGKKKKIKVEGKEYFIYSPQTPPGMEIIVFEDENGKIIGDIKGNGMWAFNKLNPLERKWIKYKFPNIPESPIGIRTKTNRYFDENAREIDLYAIQNDKLVKTGEASLPYGNDQLKILLSGGTLEIPERFKNSDSLNENASYSGNIDYKKHIVELTKHMLDSGMNIKPLPKVIFVNGDSANARQFLGKTAYYNPNDSSIVLYTEGRHPKDIVRSFSHEMIHHIQNLEGRLGNITTTNTQEDDNLNDIEAEANLKGTMTFRNWTDSLNEGLGDVSLDYIKTKLPKLDSYPKSDIILSKGDFTYINIPQDKDFGMTAEIKAFDQKDGTLVAQSSFDYDKNGKLKGTLDVRPDKRRLGIATEIYKLAEKIIGDTIFPEEKHTEDAEKFWQQKNRSFGPKTDDTLNENYQFKLTDKNYDEEDNSLLSADYNFSTADNDYRVEFYSGEYSAESKTFDLSFGLDTGRTNKLDTFQMTGEGNALSILKTITNIIKDFTNRFDVNKLVINPTSEKRKKVYSMVLKYLPQDILDKVELINEAIVGDKIECDNCGWSWNIVDGGDDLFICHKCGNDNSPLNEAKPYKHKHGFDDKLGKDPFGLNQYARELAQDLGEAILNEGRYDKITNQVSREVFTKFKEIYDSGAKEGNFSFSVGPDDEDIFSEDLEFNLEGYIEVSDEMYQPDGGANAGYDDDGEEITPLIQVSFKIPQDPKEFKWSEVSFDIKDIIRHEIEHLTQDGENLKSGKYLEDDQLIRKLINAKMLPKSQYFKLEKEVDAMLQGLYFRAKKSRTPFKEVILNYFKKVGLTKEEQKQILDVWRSRRKALALPTFENTSN